MFNIASQKFSGRLSVAILKASFATSAKCNSVTSVESGRTESSTILSILDIGFARAIN